MLPGLICIHNLAILTLSFVLAGGGASRDRFIVLKCLKKESEEKEEIFRANSHGSVSRILPACSYVICLFARCLVRFCLVSKVPQRRILFVPGLDFIAPQGEEYEKALTSTGMRKTIYWYCY